METRAPRRAGRLARASWRCWSQRSLALLEGSWTEAEVAPPVEILPLLQGPCGHLGFWGLRGGRFGVTVWTATQEVGPAGGGD